MYSHCLAIRTFVGSYPQIKLAYTILHIYSSLYYQLFFINSPLVSFFLSSLFYDFSQYTSFSLICSQIQFYIKSYTPKEPRRYPNNLRLCERGIQNVCIRYYKDSNFQPVRTQARRCLSPTSPTFFLFANFQILGFPSNLIFRLLSTFISVNFFPSNFCSFHPSFLIFFLYCVVAKLSPYSSRLASSSCNPGGANHPLIPASID